MTIGIVLQLLPIIPGLIESVMRITSVVRADPSTPDEVKTELDALNARLVLAVAAVKSVRLPSADA